MPGDRLTALDTAFLDIEDAGSAHMHVAGVMIFEGPAPTHAELCAAVSSRLHLVPRYRQRLHGAPAGVSTPTWVDDPHFLIEFHVRHTALPRPGNDAQLALLAGRVFSQRLDRSRPLWELWLVEGLEDGRFALLSKTHHCLVDGISGVDIATVLFDAEPHPDSPPAPDEPWHPRPLPTTLETLAMAVADAVGQPLGAARSAATRVVRPVDLLGDVRAAIGGLAALAAVTLRPAPPSIYNVDIGPHRRFTWVHASLDDVKFVKNTLGGTVNDVVLAAVTGMLRRHLIRRGEDVNDLELVAMVPVSVRTDLERGALGNRVSTMFAPLPVHLPDARARLLHIREEMRELKESGQAVGAEMLTRIGGLAPPTLLAQAARLAASPRTFNLTVTNVPGPQVPLYCVGRQLIDLVPMVPLAPEHALGVAIMSYHGRICFGLVADWDVLADLDEVAQDLAAELEALVAAAHAVTRPSPDLEPVTPRRAPRGGSSARNGGTRPQAPGAPATGRRPARARAGAKTAKSKATAAATADSKAPRRRGARSPRGGATPAAAPPS